jgi:hypothetical protein
MLNKLCSALKRRSKEPWASFEVTGFDDSGKIKVEFDWNDAFIKKINMLGFQAETEEDTVQLFFYASSMRPTELSSAEPVVTTQSEWHNVT